ncbi:MAG: hypothetical protein EAX89_15445 [Candidatus Lokiarchaeota archaeon]|nr:hypothetical protein [Candidatus Lokiarchaeota archaeon]
METDWLRLVLINITWIGISFVWCMIFLLIEYPRFDSLFVFLILIGIIGYFDLIIIICNINEKRKRFRGDDKNKY